MKTALSLLCALSTLFPVASADVVEATGSACGSAPEARAQALSDALREAVRMGAGVDLVSETQTKNFALEYDNTFLKARGYVRKYEVLSNELREDGIYVVTIRADVGEMLPEAGEKLAFRMMARGHQAPRVSVQVTEKLGGMGDNRVAADWLADTAAECGLKVVDAARSQGAMGERAEALGRTLDAALRKSGSVSSCDYIIEGEITGDMTGQPSFYGSKPSKRFSLGANFRVVDAATGAVLLAESVPSRDILISRVSSDEAASREAIRQMLEGSPRVANSDEGWKLIRRIFSAWAAETDLGATIKIELEGLTLQQAQQFQEQLAKQKGISAVWIRSVDTSGISVIDCESRLDSTTLARVMTKLFPDLVLERSEKRYLAFRMQSAELNPPAEGDASSLSPYVYGGLASAALLASAFFLFHHKH